MSSKPLAFLRNRFWTSDVSRRTLPLDARTATGFILCILLFSLVGWLYLTQSSQMASTGFKMRDTLDRIEVMDRRNAILRYQIAQLETLPRVEARARQIGLGPVKRTAYLVVANQQPPAALAVARSRQATPAGLEQAVTADGGSMIEIGRWWNDLCTEVEAWISKL